MAQIFYYKNTPKLINAGAANADITSEGVSCIGHSTARVEAQVTTLTDAGTIDQTVDVQGSVDGTNYNTTAIGTVSITGSSPLTDKFYSTALDIRGYAKIRLVYNHEGASAGTITCNAITVLG
jgi:hypothetical protein